ncbi:hypothetical protein ACKLNO_07620 [Neisseriaceae bacterium B1]
MVPRFGAVRFFAWVNTTHSASETSSTAPISKHRGGFFFWQPETQPRTDSGSLKDYNARNNNHERHR